MTRIAVIVLSCGRGVLTERCLDSLRSCTTNSYHVYLVDNGSTDNDTLSRLDGWANCAEITLFRLPTNLGPAAGRNVALEALAPDDDVVAMLDNDIVALPGWDRAALDALRRGADLIQPKLLEADQVTLERGPNHPNSSPLAINPVFPGRGQRADRPELNREEEAAITGTAAILRRAVLRSVGLLDPVLQIGEDFDFSLRARAAGYAIKYVPDCALVHDHGFDFNYDQERGRVEKYLIAHVVLWRRWGKALLSPSYLHWYAWLHKVGEPMYLPEGQRWRIAHRRLRRRLVRAWIMRKHPNSWASCASLEVATLKLAGVIDGEARALAMRGSDN